MPHLFVDISAHGFGHLAQTAPVLQRLGEIVGDLRLTIRSGLPAARLRQRITLPFEHIAAASDFGYLMRDAISIDRAATAAAYRVAHAGFSRRVTEETQFLAKLRPDAVLANVSYLPLAGAQRAGLPAIAMCSLNWADPFQHFFGAEDWAAPIHADMLAAYRSATFLRLTPGMPMTALTEVANIAPVAGIGSERRMELRQKLGVGDTARVAVVALGGIPMRLPVEDWPAVPGMHWLVPAEWGVGRAGLSAIESLGWTFPDLLRSVDAVVTKPGYGTFAEAACNGTAVLYQRRDDWPEQDCLIDWLQHHARCVEISATDLKCGNLAPALIRALSIPMPPLPAPDGIEQAAQLISRIIAALPQ